MQLLLVFTALDGNPYNVASMFLVCFHVMELFPPRQDAAGAVGACEENFLQIV